MIKKCVRILANDINSCLQTEKCGRRDLVGSFLCGQKKIESWRPGLTKPSKLFRTVFCSGAEDRTSSTGGLTGSATTRQPDRDVG
eukprot:2659780-Rhodomonas_salina.9